ncbi:hypothetical protein [Halorubrum lipolyticum]|uniref:Uncharacterized protein n=1 Tax=Halorubrum lipolyticum DSM 21995 TaxID=1227482 RepID=M0P1L1_9EURY|nr:hypothetical protein [Halorubrum lipolyticum]EMA63743.1 hypothetical protein C469_02771 [Halorubrum lipolyticum DSM 21995]
MCERCNEEHDDDYDGDSIAEKRRKAVASIITRHPELGLRPDDVTFRFVPKHKRQCLRINLNTDAPRYEIHVPKSMGQAMAGSPPLSGVAMAACLETGNPYEETCDVLAVPSDTHLEALFLSEEPPVDLNRTESPTQKTSFDSTITDLHSDE